MLLKDAGDGKSLMICSEVKRANSDLEGEGFSFHVIDKRWHPRDSLLLPPVCKFENTRYVNIYI